MTLDQAKHLPAEHPLRDDRRDSVEEVTDINSYAEVGGVRVTGERLRHVQYKHPEISAWKSHIETALLMPSTVRERGTLRDYFLDTGQVSPTSGKPLRLKVVVQTEPSPFILTAYLTTQK